MYMGIRYMVEGFVQFHYVIREQIYVRECMFLCVCTLVIFIIWTVLNAVLCAGYDLPSKEIYCHFCQSTPFGPACD